MNCSAVARQLMKLIGLRRVFKTGWSVGLQIKSSRAVSFQDCSEHAERI